ncbi:unnamed protein product [Dovyalis caffra]|uniref:Uncharacterized protein n=1 Tax=Dovyalis caffra TaxID=77055 RepID=A0AAV1RGV9_9ROSI|nr:unnamed protein product [Dovyalis caffra]
MTLKHGKASTNTTQHFKNDEEEEDINIESETKIIDYDSEIDESINTDELEKEAKFTIKSTLAPYFAN